MQEFKGTSEEDGTEIRFTGFYSVKKWYSRMEREKKEKKDGNFLSEDRPLRWNEKLNDENINKGRFNIKDFGFIQFDEAGNWIKMDEIYNQNDYKSSMLHIYHMYCFWLYLN